MTSAVLRFAVQRLMLSSIVILMAILLHYSLSRKSVGRYSAAAIIPPRKNAKPWKPDTAGAVARNEILRTSKRVELSICR